MNILNKSSIDNLCCNSNSSSLKATANCDIVSACINDDLGDIANERPTDLSNFCLAVSKCVNIQLGLISEGSTNLLTNYQQALFFTLSDLLGYTTNEIIHFVSENGTFKWLPVEDSGNVGTVTNFSAGNLTPLFTTTETNTTTTPHLAFNPIAQPANYVFAGPTSGGFANPTFRPLVLADIPTGSNAYIQNQFAGAQTTANWWISGHGRVNDYLQINDAGKFKKDSTGQVSLMDPDSGTGGAGLRTRFLNFYQYSSTPSTVNTPRIFSDGEFTVWIDSGLQSEGILFLGMNTLSFRNNRTEYSPAIDAGGLFPIKFTCSPETGFVGEKIKLDIAVLNTTFTLAPEDSSFHYSMVGHSFRTTPSVSKKEFVRYGASVQDFSDAGYKGDYVIELADATTHDGLPFEYLRIKYDGRIIAQNLPHESTDVDKFVVWSTDQTLKYRTGLELLSDLGVIGAGVNIYNSDGTLEGDRVLEGDSFNLSLINLGLVNITGSEFTVQTPAGTAYIGNDMTGDGGLFLMSDNVLNYGLSLIADATEANRKVILESGVSLILADGDTSDDLTFFKIADYTAAANGDILTLVDNTTGQVGWSAASPASPITVGSSVINSGTDTRVPFNDAGVYGEDADFTWIKSTNQLGIGVSSSSSNGILAIGGSSTGTATITGGGGGLLLQSNDITIQANGSHFVKFRTNSTDRFSIDSSGAWLLAGSAGTSGQVLTSAGAGAPPTWQSKGTVTSFTFTDANGFDGTVTNSTSTPTLSLTTTVSDTQVIYSTSGALTGSSAITTTGQAVKINSTNTNLVTTNSILAVSGNSLTTGTGIYGESSSLTSGKLVNLVINGTAAATGQVALNIAVSGANAGSSVTTYGLRVSNTHSGTGAISYSAQFDERVNIGGATNTANMALLIKSLTNTATEGVKILSNNEASNLVISSSAITTSGDLDITPSAKVTVNGYIHAAGSTAPIRIDDGSLLGTAAAGAIEFSSTKLYFTPSGTDRRFVMLGGRNLQTGTSYSVLVADMGKIIGLSNTAARSIALIPASSALSGEVIWFKDEAGTAGTNNITITADGADTIDGAATAVINQNYAIVGIYSNGSSKWFVI